MTDVTTESKDKPVTIEYAGEELIVVDDEHGVAKFIPVPKANLNQDFTAEIWWATS